MARIRMAYIGGGSTRGAGTMASFIHQGQNFDGSEVVLIDLDADRLDLIRRLAERMVKARGLDITVEATTDRRAGLAGCDAILSSYRPGGFAARVLDEKIPLKHGVIGQETQGPGGFFMALRAIHAMQGILADAEDVCPGVRIFNYTNPVNILAQAVTSHSDVPFVSLCEGPIYFSDQIAKAADLDREQLDTVMVGLNHACWSVTHEYRGADAMPLIAEAWERRKDDPELTGVLRRQLRIAAEMGAIPADYFQYYYCQDEVLAELRAKPTTRAEDILGWSTGYWEHYAEQAERDDPELDPQFSRGGIHELELAIDAMDAVFNEKDEELTVNVPNTGGALPGFDESLVVELLGRCGGPRRLDPAAARARRAAEGRLRARARARRVPDAGGRRGLVGHPPRRHPRARRAPADGRSRPHRAHLRRARDGPSRASARAPAAGLMFLGVDGGNTKTVALACGRDGRIAGHARTGCGDIYEIEPGLAVAEVVRAARTAIAEAGGGEVACAYYSLAGADWPVDIAYLQSELARSVPAARTIVVNDAIGAIRCGADDGVGCSFVCGTGTALGARAADGRLWHVSWLAAPFFTIDLTRTALDAAVRSELGMAPASSLPQRVAAAYGTSDAAGALELLTGRAPRPPRRSLGGVLLDCAAEGDELALERIGWVARENAAYLRAGARACGLGEPTPVTLAGGVLRHPSALLVDALAAALPGCELRRARREPAHGALLAALEEGGAPRVELDDSALPADLFATALP